MMMIGTGGIASLWPGSRQARLVLFYLEPATVGEASCRRAGDIATRPVRQSLRQPSWLSRGRAALFLILAAQPALAERNFVPTLERSYDVCPDRPEEPLWLQEIPLRQVYHRVLIQDIYRAQNLARVIETGRCDCGTRFPSWDAAEAEFLERYADDERWEMLQASEVYNRRANAARREAQAICEAAGNW